MEPPQGRGTVLPGGRGLEDLAGEGECPLGCRGGGDPLQVVEQAGELVVAEGWVAGGGLGGKQGVEVDGGELGELCRRVLCVARGEGAEEGVGQQTGGLLLADGQGEGLLPPEQRHRMRELARHAQGQLHYPRQEGAKEAPGLLPSHVLLEVRVQAVKPPLPRVARVVGQNGVGQLVGAGDGSAQRCAHQVPLLCHPRPLRGPAPLHRGPAHRVPAVLGAGQLDVVRVPCVGEGGGVGLGRGGVRAEQHHVGGRGAEGGAGGAG